LHPLAAPAKSILEMASCIQEAMNKKKAEHCAAPGLAAGATKAGPAKKQRAEAPSAGPAKKPRRQAPSPAEAAGGPAPERPRPSKANAPVHYLGGVVYTDTKNEAFRVKVKSSDRQDRKIRWQGQKLQAWDKALSLIEEGDA
jgi:hypothetical protein